MNTNQQVESKVSVGLLKKLSVVDLITLCEAAETTMLDTYGFRIGSKKWHPPMSRDLEEYFTGVMLIQERQLIVGRIGKDIVGSLQLLFPHKLNKSSNFAVSMYDLFVLHAARNSGVAEAMIKFAEKYSRMQSYTVMKLAVESIRTEALSLFEKLGYKRWGVLDKFVVVGNEIISGHFYCKDL